MDFSILGPLRVRDDGAEVQLPGGKARLLLAALLAEAGRIVSADRLVDILWGDEPPRSPNALHNILLRLRQALGDTAAQRIRTVAPGYLIEVRDDELDVLRFTRLWQDCLESYRGGRWVPVIEDVGDAMALWRGTPLVDVESPFTAEVADRLAERRRDLLGWRAEAYLELGLHHEAIDELRTLTREYPYEEPLHALLMLGLQRAGRPAEAISAYQALESALDAELQVEPGEAIQELYRRILIGDPALGRPLWPTPTSTPISTPDSRPPRGPAVVPTIVPAQLPPSLADFTGRHEQLAALAECAIVDRVSVVSGMGGVGKTSLVLRLAHDLRANYPDGQLFATMYGESAVPRDPAEVLGRFLRDLGVAPGDVPVSAEEAGGMFRSLASTRRLLIVLDNVHSADQIRPLLPGGDSCLVLATSRRRLVDLDGASSLAVGVLPETEGVELFARIVGDSRPAEEPEAAAEVLRRCGHLPLAIRIAGARLRHRAAWTVAELAETLRDERSRLSELDSGERSVAAVFGAFDSAMPEAQQRMFRLLGVVPGADFDAYAAAALADLPLGRSRSLVEGLVDANLLQQPASGRYRFHDLLRQHSRNRLAECLSADGIHAAAGRLLDYYLRTAALADHRLGRRSPMDAEVDASADANTNTATKPPASPVLDTEEKARAWMRTEESNLSAAVDYAATNGHLPHAIRLPAVMFGYLRAQGLRARALSLYRTALDAAVQAGERADEAVVLAGLGRAQRMSEDFEGARTTLLRAVELSQEVRDRRSEAQAWSELGDIHRMVGDNAEGISSQHRALELFRDLGDRQGQADALTVLGLLVIATSGYPDAVSPLSEARDLYEALGDRIGQVNVLNGISECALATGDYKVAAEAAEQALALSREVGSPIGELNALIWLAAARRSAGRLPDAAETSGEALRLSREISSRNGEARALKERGIVEALSGDHETAVETLSQALAICRDIDNPFGAAHSLKALGDVFILAGRLPEAAEALAEALRLHACFGNRFNEAETLVSTGRLALAAGSPTEAASRFQEALKIARDIAAPVLEAEALTGISQAESPPLGLDHRSAEAPHKSTRP